ncbi:MAG: hypothetical protein COA52_16440 [Hyphomicrobiales bacterium]|nr:MAG: hypothetical protein COA52_16440 [Hyphomicrobiales bacterium]
MNTKIMLVLGVLVLGLLNFSIFQNERILDSGEIVLLELAPVDPRSLMQGDFMHLRYAVEREASKISTETTPASGFLIVRPDEMNVGRLVGFSDAAKPRDEDRLVRYHLSYNRVRVAPDAFFFQEGQAEQYETAKYGVFKFAASGKHLLVGLADETGKTILAE